MSTATLVVEVAKSAVGKWGTAGGKSKRKPLGGREVSDNVVSFLVHLTCSLVDVRAPRSRPDECRILETNCYRTAQERDNRHLAW